MSTDNYSQVLEPYIARGEVELTEWTNEKQNYVWQMTAYADGLKKARGVTKWLAVIDLDEFIVPIEQDNLIDFLKPFEEFGGVGINWLMFGTSNVNKIPDNGLMTEHLVMCQGTVNQHVKSIIQPDKVTSMGTQHHANYKQPYYQVTTEKVKFSGPFNPGGNISKIRINHYWTQDAYFCFNTKIQRFVNCHMTKDDYIKKLEMTKFVLDENIAYNKQRDYAIAKYVPTLKENMK